MGPLPGDVYAFAKEDKIIYHESVHAILDAVNGNHLFDPNDTEEGAIGEAVSDYFAGAFTDRVDSPTDSKIIRGSLAIYFNQRDMADPLTGIDTYSDYQSIRDNVQPFGEVPEHDGGEFFSAVLWDLRQDFSVDTDDIDAIVLAAASRVDGEPDFFEYRDAMLAEDVSNYGGIYQCDIKQAFANRSIGTVPMYASISGPTSLSSGEQGTWSASVGGCGSGSYSYQWYEKYDGDSSFNPISGATSSSHSDSYFGNVELKVVVMDGSLQASSAQYVSVGCGQYCVEGRLDPTTGDSDASGVENTLPSSFELKGLTPNPVRTTATFSFALPEAAHVQIVVYDIMGREVSRPIERNVRAGQHHVLFDVSSLQSGVYVYQLQAGDSFTDTRKLVVVK